MLRLFISAVALVVILADCKDENEKEMSVSQQPTIDNVQAALSFTCIHETDHLPSLDKETEILFQYARWLQKQPSPQDFKMIGRLYRIAAAHNNYKAANNLQTLISVGSVDSPYPQKETIDLVEQLINQNIPSGLYAMGHYLELGYGVALDKEKALSYFRKAADMGNADAQFYVADLLEPVDRAPTIAHQMRQCAADQGHGKAASSLGMDMQIAKLFPEAVKAFQEGVRNGDSQSASYLTEGFKGHAANDELNYLALPKDEERVERYGLIWKFLLRYDGRNPKVPDIDKIVPLPPAPLPAWDGTFQWEKEFKSAKAPEMPSEALIKKLAQAKGLDPSTGLPLAKGK